METGLKLQQLFPAVFAGTVFVIVAAPALHVQAKPVEPTRNIRQLSNTELPANSASVLAQSPPSKEVVQVTGVRANPTDKGLELILQTSFGEKLQVTNRSAGNSFIADIPNAQLRYKSGETFTFQSKNPVTGITQITVTNFDANTIRVTVTGEKSVPVVELFDSPDEGLILSFATAASPTPQQQQQTPPQEQPDQIQPSQSSEDEEIEIVVTGEEDRYFIPDSSTATRTDTPILETPASIQVIPQQVLEDQQATDIIEALDNVSGLTVNSAEGLGAEINIRGFNNVPLLIDGFRLYGFSQPIETANLERIEVLRGPASILYGEVQPGGIVNLVTKKPLAEPFYDLQFQAGSYGLIRPQIDLSGPLAEDGSVLYRLNALYSREDGFRNFDTEYKRFFVSPVVTWKIGDRTDFTISLEYLDLEQPYDPGLVAAGNGIADVPYDRIFNQPDDISIRNVLNFGYNLEHRFSKNWTLRNGFRYTQQDYTSQVAIPFSYDEAAGILTRYYSEQTLDLSSYSVQTNVVGKFATGSIGHTLLAGVDLNRSFSDEATLADVTSPLPQNIFNPQYQTPPRPSRDNMFFLFGGDLKTNRLGVYVQDQIAFSDNLTFVAGLRYDTVDREDRLNQTSDYNDAVTPRLGIVYQPVETVSLYASYSQSFAPSSSRDADSNLLEPEQGEGFEVGVKTELLDGRLFASLAYFDITKQNVATADPIILGAFIATGEQQSQGIELDVRGEISPGWNLLASYSYIDAKITEDNEPLVVDNELPGVPRNSASLWTTYQIQSGNLQGLGFGLGINFVGNREGDRENTFELGSYFLTNAAIFYRRDNWRLGLNFRNIFDVDYIRGESSSRFRRIEPGEPFTVVGSVSVQF